MTSLKQGFLKIKQALAITVTLMLVCGLAFPLVLTGISQVLFPHEANGSLIEVNGEAIGSIHVGQQFSEDYFMKGRPSAVGYNTYEEIDGKLYLLDGSEYNGVASGSNNYAATNEALALRVEEDINNFLVSHKDIKKEDIPTDLLTASGSGLDPHISLASAKIQVSTIAKASGLSEEELNQIIIDNTTNKFLGIFGEEYVNVLMVNLDIAKAMGLI